MPLENATQIQQLVSTNPLGTDPEAEGDNHIRMLKLCMQNSLPNLQAPWDINGNIKTNDPVAPRDLVNLQYLSPFLADPVLKIGYPFIWLMNTDPVLPVGQELVELSGQIMSRAGYPRLFAMYGTFWGAGDGSTTFQLPDPSGYFLRVRDNGKGRDPDAATRTGTPGGGAPIAAGSTQQDEIKSHSHGLPIQSSGVAASQIIGTFQQAGSSVSSATGGAETRAKNIYIRLMIRTK